MLFVSTNVILEQIPDKFVSSYFLCKALYICVMKAACGRFTGIFQTEKGKSTNKHIKNY